MPFEKRVELASGEELVLSGDEDTGHLIISGVLDISNGDLVRDQISSMISASDEVVIDLTQLSFIDSIGLGILVNANKQATAGEVDLRVMPPVGAVAKTFQLVGLDALFASQNKD